ncbi:MAG: type II toxin-antitoxin system HicB family antitoxin [Chloroflexi bacterium]|nr:type II toxin-antitoxin system HicB family antitoxin [Chloroflexota bacterium]
MQRRKHEPKRIEYYLQLPFSILLHQVEDEGQKYWIAEIPKLPGCKSHGSTVEEAVQSVQEAKKDWIADSLEKGEPVPVPMETDAYSGRVLLRMSRSLHRALSLMAESEKLSLNQLMVTILAKEVGQSSALSRVEKKIDRLLEKFDNLADDDRMPALPL